MKKIILMLTLFTAVTGFLFFLLMNHFYLSIENYSGRRVVVDRVELGMIPISQNSLSLEPREFISMSAYKISAFPRLFVEMTDDKGLKKYASCELDVVGSDSCRITILSDGTLNCSECYK